LRGNVEIELAFVEVYRKELWHFWIIKPSDYRADPLALSVSHFLSGGGFTAPIRSR